MKEPGNRILEAETSIDRALDLLFVLHDAPQPLGVTEVARAGGLPKSSAHRLLAALSRRGLVERDERGRYAPGFALLALGLGVQSRDTVAAVARPVLFELAESLGETVFLCSVHAGALVVVDKAEGAGFLRAAPRVGARIPVHATAVGMLFLALRPGLLELGPEPYEAFGPTTPRTRPQLEARLEGVRALGVAESLSTWIPGLWVMAAPIRWRGDLCAAVAVAAPEARMPILGPVRVEQALRAAARRIDSRLAGRDPKNISGGIE